MLIKYYDEDIIGYIILTKPQELELLAERVERYEYVSELSCKPNCSSIGGYRFEPRSG